MPHLTHRLLASNSTHEPMWISDALTRSHLLLISPTEQLKYDNPPRMHEMPAATCEAVTVTGPRAGEYTVQGSVNGAADVYSDDGLWRMFVAAPAPGLSRRDLRHLSLAADDAGETRRERGREDQLYLEWILSLSSGVAADPRQDLWSRNCSQGGPEPVFGVRLFHLSAPQLRLSSIVLKYDDHSALEILPCSARSIILLVSTFDPLPSANYSGFCPNRVIFQGHRSPPRSCAGGHVDCSLAAATGTSLPWRTDIRPTR